ATDVPCALCGEPYSRDEAIASAGNLPSLSKEATLALLKQPLKSLPAKQQVALLEALGKSKVDEATAALIDGTRAEEAEVRSTAVRLLSGRTGEAAGTALVE